MSKDKSRRDFIKKSINVCASSMLAAGFLKNGTKNSIQSYFAEQKVDISVVKGKNYFNNTLKVLDPLGGIGNFVPKGSKVAILVNSQSSNPGTYTKPEILRAVIQMCKKQDVSEINVLSWLSKKSFEKTKLLKAIEEEGAELKIVDSKDESFFKTVAIPKGKILKETKIMKELYANDIFINMPITKDHAGNKFTGTMKNLMGLNFAAVNRKFHTGNFTNDNIEHLDQCIADLNTIIKPTLCIVDATEFIKTNGPFGPGEIIKPNRVIAGVDRVAIDAYCATLWGLKGDDIIMINRAYEHKLGEIDITKLIITEVEI